MKYIQNINAALLMCFFLLMEVSFCVQAQTSYPAGVYMSLAELQQKRPSQQHNLQVKKRTPGNITMIGGNDYKFLSPDKSVKKKVIKKKIWAIADSSGLYLNCFHHKCQIWYAKVEEETDSILVFKAAISNAEASGKAATTGALGGAIGGAAAGASMAKRRYTYRLDLSTRKVILISKHTEASN